MSGTGSATLSPVNLPTTVACINQMKEFLKNSIYPFININGIGIYKSSLGLLRGVRHNR